MLQLRELAQGGQQVSSSSAGGTVYSAVATAVYRASPKFEKIATLPISPTLLESNSSGTLVAAAAGSALYVLSESGATEAALSTPSPVLQLLWHPCGVNDACLVVLVQGSVLMYYLSSKGLHTETYKLASTSASSINVNSTVASTVSIAFGSPADETGLFTLYLVSDEADIYSLCPFLPPEFSLPSDTVRGVLDAATSDEFNLRQGGQGLLDESRAEQRVLNRQLVWAQDIFKQAGTCELVWNESNNTSCLVFKRPARPLLAIQGPIKQSPYSDFLYNEDTLGLGFMAAGPASIAVVQTTSHVLFYLVDSPARLMWSGAIAEPRETLSLIEAVSIPETKGRLYVSNGIVFVQSSESTIAVDPVWISAFIKSFETGEVGDLPSSKVEQLPQAIIEAHHNHVSAFGVESGKLLHRWSPLSSQPSKQIQLQQQPSYQYESLLGDCENMRRVTALVEAMDLKAPHVPRNSQITNDLESYEDLFALAEHYEVEMGRLYKATSAAYVQLDVQRSEQHRQLSKLSETLELAQMLNKAQLLERVTKTVQRQKALQERVSALSSKVNKQLSASLPLSQNEKKFFAELQRLQESIEGPRGLGARVDNVSAQADTLREPAAATAPAAPWTPALRAIKSHLDVQTVTLDGLRKEITQLEKPTGDTAVYDLSQIS